MFKWFLGLISGAESVASQLQSLTPEQHDWIFTNFKGAWSLQTFDPAVFDKEPELNIWAFLGEHRLFFFNKGGQLHVDVVIGYRREGIPLCTIGYVLATEELRHQFLERAAELENYQAPSFAPGARRLASFL